MGRTSNFICWLGWPPTGRWSTYQYHPLLVPAPGGGGEHKLEQPWGKKSRCVGVGAEEKRTKARTHTALMVGGTRHRAQWSYVGHKKGLVRISQGDWWGVRLAGTLNGPKLQHSTLTNRGRLFFNQLLSSNKFVPGIHRVLCSCSLSRQKCHTSTWRIWGIGQVQAVFIVKKFLVNWHLN